MNNIRLKLNGNWIQLPDDINLNLSKSFIDDENDFSYSFELPATAEVQQSLNYNNKLHVLNKFSSKIKAELWAYESLVLDGYLYIDTANDKYYSCNLIGKKNIVTELSDIVDDERTINKLKPDKYKYRLNTIDIVPVKVNSKYDASKIGEEPYRCDNLGLIYPLSYYGQPFTNDTVGLYTVNSDQPLYQGYTDFGIYNKDDNNDNVIDKFAILNPGTYMVPSFNVTDIVKSIFIDKYGDDVKFSGNFFNNPDFSNLYQTFQGTIDDYYNRDNKPVLTYLHSRRIGMVSDGKSTVRDIDGKIFEFIPDNDKYVEVTEDSKIKFFCYKLLNRTNGSDFKYNDTTDKYLNPIDVTDNEYKNIVIRPKKSGWYNISGRFVLNYNKEHESDVYVTQPYQKGKIFSHDSTTNYLDVHSSISSYVNTPSHINTGSHIINDTATFYNNIWEFQIVKKDSDPKLYSNIYSSKIQDLQGNINYIKKPWFKFELSGSDDRGIYVPTIYGDEDKNNKFPYIKFPTNQSTILSNDDDLVMSIRIGNQTSFPIEDNIQSKYFNRSTYGNILNLPIIDKTSESDDYYYGFKQTDEGPVPDSEGVNDSVGGLNGINLIRLDGNFVDISSMDYWKTNYYRGFGWTNQIKDGRTIGNVTHKTYSKDTAFQILNNKSYSTNIKDSSCKYILLKQKTGTGDPGIGAYYDGSKVPWKLNFDDFSNVVFSRPDSDDNTEGFEFNVKFNDYTVQDPFSDTPIFTEITSNENSSAVVNYSNAVYLEKGVEYEFRLITPVIKDFATLEDEEPTEYPVATNIDDFEFYIRYFGCNEEDIDYNVLKDSFYRGYNYTYFTQYLPEEKVKDWLDNLVNTFNLSIKYDNKNNEVIIASKKNLDDLRNVDDILNIDKFVDFGTIVSENNITIERKDLPKNFIFNWGFSSEDEPEVDINESNTSFNIYTGGSEDDKLIKSKYLPPSFSSLYDSTNKISTPKEIYGRYDKGNMSTEYIIGSSIPVISKVKDFEGLLSGDYNKYNFSGSNKARLFYWYGNKDLKHITIPLGSSDIILPRALNYDMYDKYFEEYQTNQNIPNQIFPTFVSKNPKTGVDLKNPLTILNKYWIETPSLEYIEVTAYLPVYIYNNLTNSSIVKLDDSYFKIIKIDEYNITGDFSCKITLSPI